MKTKICISVLFVCALIIISIVSIESSKDEKQLDTTTTELKTKIGIHVYAYDPWRNWKRNRKVGKTGKTGGQGSSGSSLEGSGGEGGEENGGEENGGEKE
ncbi:unnamed protein product [Lathyrus oleraceus]